MLQTRSILAFAITVLAACLNAAERATRESAPCRIEVVEAGSHWPVPLIQLRTTHNLLYVTDNAGLIEVDAPELMNREVFFHVEGHGYEVRPDGFGYRGVKLTPRSGATLRVTVQRKIIAKRLGRLTGAGLFAHSDPLHKETGVVGCDSVLSATHQNRQFWIWGDTSRQSYPLGIFHSSGATTSLKPLESFEPPVRMPYEYFRGDSGNPRAVAKMPGSGPTWLGGLVSLPDRTGQPRLVACYAKITPPLEEYETGLCVWNDAESRFEKLKVVWTKSKQTPRSPPTPKGHPVLWQDDNGKRWVLFGNPFPRLQCEATYEAWQDPDQWQVIEPQKSLAAADGGKTVTPHTGSIAWNAYRQRWVTVFMERFGNPSAFGELWYAEADSPKGAWGPAVKVLSHNNYTFYNPRIHPELTPNDSSFLVFEGTYTQMFSNKASPTPRYDYNQILYRLDLDDERLSPAKDD